MSGRERVGLVLIDIDMPVMDGVAFLDRGGADPSTAELPVMVVSAD